jgi:glycosyltransferase involved in cell wall biosynthesis
MKTKEMYSIVSIGMPVYNGAKTIEKAIKSLLAQTFQDFELIISDNASYDETQDICKRFALQDKRIRYVRQSKNIGVYKNFNFLMSIAKGKYFMWAAHDDWRSPEFLKANVFALESNLRFVASTSPNCFEGDENNTNSYIDFNLEGTLKDRFTKFLQHAWYSHGIFYSLMRSDIIKKNKVLDFSYAGTDWSFIFFLMSKGEINRTKEGLTVLGVNGVSMSKDPWKVFRNKPIEFFIPLYEFSKYSLGLMKNLKYNEWVCIFVKLLKVNLQAMRDSYPRTIKDFLGKICKKS